MKKSITTLLTCVILSMGATANAAPKMEDITQCMRKNFPKSVTVRKLRFSTKDATGTESNLAGRVYATMAKQKEGRDLMRGTLIIEEPRNLYGASYLVIETQDYLRDGMFVYMPAVGRVRRVSGSFADGPMMGTKFSYFEFKQIANAFGDLSGYYVKTEELEGRPSHVLLFQPVEGLETRYTSVMAWVDEPTCLISKAEFYEGKKLIKKLEARAASLRKSGDQWYHGQILMHDLTDGAKTTITVDNVTSNEQISNYRFHPKTFYEVR